MISKDIVDAMNTLSNVFEQNDPYMDTSYVMGCKLVRTCTACPEQYDVFLKEGDKEKQIGYLRLRHGWFRADYLECGGETVYSTWTMNGDGIFSEDERKKYLEWAIGALLYKHHGVGVDEIETKERQVLAELRKKYGV
jgi:hypothetical protein